MMLSMSRRAAPVGRSDEADAARPGRQRSFALFGEQALGPKFVFERQEPAEEQSFAGRPQGVNVQLVLAARFVDAEAAVRLDRLAVARREDQLGRRPAPHHAAQFRAGILEGEVQVPRRRARQVRDLAFDPQVLQAIVRIEQPANVAGESRDRPDVVHRVTR